MKLNTSSAPVVVSGGGDTSQFSIAVNAKAFRVLSDTLYQNKIGSIVRELCCNAKDSHVSANKASEPFIVHIPDAYEPWFAVQDFGIGLSPADINDVFTVYFKSTKDNSNETVGAFGLGAKTPFSYTDQFTVTSVYNGERRIYSAFINETGMPSIVEMDASKTNDKNGVEIKMSVKREDFQKFKNEVQTQLRFFTVKPIIQNCVGLTFPALEKDFIIENDDVSIANGSGYGNKFFIIQGEVGYPLDVAQLNGKITVENKELLDRLSYNQLCLYFKIGQIGVTASREGVEYNADTIKNIDAKLTTARKKLEEYIKAQLVKCKTTWEKVQFINRGTINSLAAASGITLPNVKKANNNNYYFDLSSLIREVRTKPNASNPTLPPVKYTAPTGDFKYWQRYKTSRVDAPSENFAPPVNDASIVFVVRDTANRPNVRAKYLFETNAKLTTVYEFAMYDRENTDWDDFIKKLSEAMGDYPIDKIVKLSEVELPAKVVDASGKSRATYTRPTHYCFTNTDITSVRSWDRNYDGLESVEDDVVYIVIKDMAPTMANPYAVFEKYNTMKRFMEVPSLVAIREGDLDKIKDNDLFTELTVYIDRVVDRLKNDVKLRVKRRHSLIASSLTSRFPHYIMMDSTLSAINKEASGSTIGRALQLTSKRIMSSAELAKANAIANLVGWKDEVSHVAEKKINCFHDEMSKRYPLVYVMNEWPVRSNVSAEHLAKYLRVM